ncbi:ubiquitin-like modifier-activating enzyme 6 [Ruditapes philippinarum]|uniref:ubiquitin-like modifier-activating enzyme 6 n=1 Tax=Ruditapes philippinarum TaxID=129788 RepID=UPI00295C05C7|nr:ubiquitin-like modifier-activating enzyme 6 [Ruditapes philippinarum]
MATEVEIDDSLYSRQRYVLGDGAMKRMAKASVLLYGMGGLGIEIGKNIVLAGVKCLTVQDPNISTTLDLGTQFFLRPEDVQNKKNRAEASVHRLRELNPYVSIDTLTSALNESTDLQYLKQFQCVILTELPHSVQVNVNSFCRTNGIQFISADVYGLFCGAFCDFGDSFNVVDPTGEEPKEVFIANITKDNPGVVTCLDHRMHGFETDDTVTFKEVSGMTEINKVQCKIKVISPYAFSICDTSGSDFSPYISGGICTQVKVAKTLTFENLQTQLIKPDILVTDFSKMEVPISIHAGFNALYKFRESHGRLPNVWCSEDADKMLALVTEMKGQGKFTDIGEISDDVIRLLSYTCRGSFLPLCAALGGIVAQEALKAITGKFTPLKQWLYLDAIEVIDKDDRERLELFQAKGDRYDQLRICVGEHTVQKLHQLKLFMVGCGAIGCEMLKNYAMMGVATQQPGKITITDNDLIEKSNLNRQFLFRPQHIRKPKSTTAAQAVQQINAVLQRLSESQPVEGAVQASKLLVFRPKDWPSCVHIGRLKFEKYFNHKAKHLLHAFPLDTKISDGSPFWQSPKRPPTPIQFDSSNPLHLQFVIATAHLYADNNKISVPKPVDIQQITKFIADEKFPNFWSKEGLDFTIWDRWDIKGNPDFTLQNLLDKLKAEAQEECVMDLVVSFPSFISDEDIGGPPVRYFFGL